MHQRRVERGQVVGAEAPAPASSPGAADSMRTSAPATSSRSRARPSASVEVEDHAPLAPVVGPERAASRPGPGSSPAKGPTGRAGEPPGGSTATTSAPSPARIMPASWPRSAVRSSTRYGDNAPTQHAPPRSGPAATTAPRDMLCAAADRRVPVGSSGTGCERRLGADRSGDAFAAVVHDPVAGHRGLDPA